LIKISALEKPMLVFDFCCRSSFCFIRTASDVKLNLKTIRVGIDGGKLKYGAESGPVVRDILRYIPLRFCHDDLPNEVKAERSQSDGKVWFGGICTLDEVLVEIFKSLHAQIEKLAGILTDNIAVLIPGSFGIYEKLLLRDSAKRAGFHQVKLYRRTAAMSVGIEDDYFMMIRSGNHFCEIIVCARNGNHLKILASRNSRFTGSAVTVALFNYLKNKFSVSLDANEERILFKDCEVAKNAFSENGTSFVVESAGQSFKLDIEEVKHICGPIIEFVFRLYRDFKDSLAYLVNHISVPLAVIQKVYTSGGNSRLPFFCDSISEAIPYASIESFTDKQLTEAFKKLVSMDCPEISDKLDLNYGILMDNRLIEPAILNGVDFPINKAITLTAHAPITDLLLYEGNSRFADECNLVAAISVERNFDWEKSSININLRISSQGLLELAISTQSPTITSNIRSPFELEKLLGYRTNRCKLPIHKTLTSVKCFVQNVQYSDAISSMAIYRAICANLLHYVHLGELGRFHSNYTDAVYQTCLVHLAIFNYFAVSCDPAKVDWDTLKFFNDDFVPSLFMDNHDLKKHEDKLIDFKFSGSEVVKLKSEAALKIIDVKRNPKSPATKEELLNGFEALLIRIPTVWNDMPPELQKKLQNDFVPVHKLMQKSLQIRFSEFHFGMIDFPPETMNTYEKIIEISSLLTNQIPKFSSILSSQLNYHMNTLVPERNKEIYGLDEQLIKVMIDLDRLDIHGDARLRFLRKTLLVRCNLFTSLLDDYKEFTRALQEIN
jgi:hypothetical protein